VSPHARSIVSRAVLAAASVSGIVLVLVHLRAFTHIEAAVNGWLVRVTGVADSHSLGSAVVFFSDNRFIGYTITMGCSTALLFIPLLGVTAIGASFGRLTWARAGAALLAATTLQFLVNQVRLGAVAGSMRAWGFDLGYERSHVLIGSAVSTIGLAASVVVFVFLIGRGRWPRQRRRQFGRARHAV
jgi:hypothetical protein